MSNRVKIGAVLQQHYNNPKQLGYDIFNCILNLNLNSIDCIIFDIRDISGRLFIDIETDQGIPQKSFFPYFNQVWKLCEEYRIKIYFGIPCFHNAMIDYDNIVFHNGTVMSGRVCPSSNKHKEKTIEFFKAVHEKYNNTMFFLPFYRYPPLSRGLSCFCHNCKQKWDSVFGNDLPYEQIVRDFSVFNQWQDYKAEIMFRFIKELKENTNYYIAPEIDIDPARGLFEGIQLNDCQEIMRIRSVAHHLRNA